MNKISEQELANLMQKQMEGACTEAEEKLLQEWFENVPAFEDITFISEEEKEAVKAEIQSQIRQHIEGAGNKSAKRAMLYQLKWFKAVAAILVLGLMFGSIYYYIGTTSTAKQVTVLVPAGIEKLPIYLPDSSLVWLSGGSSLSYPEWFDSRSRNVTLEGNAYFSITPDKRSPFTVHTKKLISVKVLGTSFVIEDKTIHRDIRVSVITGAVQVNNGSKRLSQLKPGERLTYVYADNTFSKESYLPKEISGWKDNQIIYFKEISLSELSILLKSGYGADLRYDSLKTASYRFTMSYEKAMPLDDLLGLLQEISGLRFDRKMNEVTVVVP